VLNEKEIQNRLYGGYGRRAASSESEPSAPIPAPTRSDAPDRRADASQAPQAKTGAPKAAVHPTVIRKQKAVSALRLEKSAPADAPDWSEAEAVSRGLEQFRSELSELQKRRAQMKGRLQRRRQKEQPKSKALDRLSARLNTLQQERRRLETRLKKAQEPVQPTRVVRAFRSQLTQMERERRRLEAELKRHQEPVLPTRKEMEALQVEILRLQQERDGIAARLTETGRKLVEAGERLEAHRRSVAPKLEQLQALQSQWPVLQREQVQLANRVRELEGLLGIRQEALNRLQADRSRLESALQLQQERERLQEKEAQRLRREMETATLERERLAARLQIQGGSVASKETALTQLQEEVVRTRVERDRFSREVAGLKEASIPRESSLKESHNRINRLVAERQALQTALERRRPSAAGLYFGRMKKLRSRMAELRRRPAVPTRVHLTPRVIQPKPEPTRTWIRPEEAGLSRTVSEGRPVSVAALLGQRVNWTGTVVSLVILAGMVVYPLGFRLLQASPASMVGEITPYTVQVAVYDVETLADKAVGHLQQLGYPAFLNASPRRNGKLRYRVYLGEFVTSQEAEEQRRDFLEDARFPNFRDAFVRVR